MNISEFQIGGILIIPVIVGISQVLKKVGLDTRYIPLLNILLGLGAGISVADSYINGIVAGVAIGLSASGVYDNVKAGFNIITDK